MEALANQQCEACQLGAPKATQAEVDVYMRQLPDWKIIEVEHVPQLSRVFLFDDFQTAVAFTNQVAELAESEGHHPAITTEWGRVTVRWWTHKINGLHRNDFVLAAKTDQLT